MRSPRLTAVTALLAAALLVTWVGGAAARRLPMVGGIATVSLDGLRAAGFQDAHTRRPFIERVDGNASAAELLAQPPLAGFPGWQSELIDSLSVSDGSRRWTLGHRADDRAVVEALASCLDAGSGDSWGARALEAAGVAVTPSSEPGATVVTLSAPVGPFPELLAGCAGPGDGAAFAPEPDGSLRAVPGPRRPFLDSLQITSAGARADVEAWRPGRSSEGSQLAGPADVLLLVQDTSALARDPFGVAEDHRRRSLVEQLSPSLLLAVYWEGRGAPAERLLPRGVGPQRPRLERAEAGSTSPSPPPRLEPLPTGAPRVAVRHAASDPLAAGTVARLAVLARGRGWALADDESDADTVVELLRWRPPTRDPSLALLELASRVPALDALPRERDLLDPDAEKRVAAAIATESQWLASGHVLPLMTAYSAVTVSSGLRGVRLREDGVPLMHDAWWSSPP